MEEKKSIFKRIHNDGFTWHDSFIVIVFLFLFLIIVASNISGFAYDFIGRAFPNLEEDGFLSLFIMYMATIVEWLVFFIYCALTKRNRFILGTLTTKSKGNTIKMLLFGLLVGFAENTLGILVATINKDIDLAYDSFHLFRLLLMFVAVFIQSSSEEFLCRAFLYQRLKKGYRSEWVAVIGNALIFMALHLFNPGISLIPIAHLVAIAIFYSLIIYYFDSIWLTMAAHAAWNYTQNIIFGLPNSGIVSSFSVMKLVGARGQTTFAYDPVFGVEGALFLLIVTIVMTVVLIYFGEKHKRKEKETNI